jgi:hypothetical protein
VRVVVPRDARDHSYLALKVDNGGRGRVGAAFGCGGSGCGGCGCVGLGRGPYGGGAYGDGELLGLLVLSGVLVWRLFFGAAGAFRGRRDLPGGWGLPGRRMLGGLFVLGREFALGGRLVRYGRRLVLYGRLARADLG